jgi:hypothetical protein
LITTVVSTDGSDYLGWQAELLAYSYHRVGQPGRLVVLTDTVKVPGDDYPPYNKPYALARWLEREDSLDECLLVLDPDMVFVRAVDRTVRPGRPVAHNSSYAANHALAAALTAHAASPRDLQPLAVPMLIHQQDLRRLAPLWFDYTRRLRSDAAIRDLIPWVCEMWACSIAAQELSLVFELQQLAAVPPFWSRTGLPLVHYSFEFEGFDKRSYRPWDPLPNGTSQAYRWLRDLIDQYRGLGRQ